MEHAQAEAETNLITAYLRLRPFEEIVIPTNQRRQVYWLFLQLVSGVDEALAEELRIPGQSRPFTLANIYCPTPNAPRERGQVHLTPDQDCYIRVTGLNRRLVETFFELKEKLPLEVYLGEVRMQVLEFITERADQSPVSRIGVGSYQSILEANFYRFDYIPERFELRFLTATGFKAEEQELALPLPRLVFGSLLHRWNTFSPGPLAEDSHLFAGLTLKLGRYRIESRTILVDQQYHTGFTGPVEFKATSHDRFYLQTLSALCDFSFFSGVGYQTAAGMGQVERYQLQRYEKKSSQTLLS